jgi:dTDP-4-amino-4,6-dideoxygalactose transaminase
MAQTMTSRLALFGGEKGVRGEPGDMFKWPIVTPEMEAAVLDVLRAGTMSGTDVTREFEREFADWHGLKFGLAHNTGTAAIHSALFGLGIGKGDEIICPSLTYWASCLPVYSLGGSVTFADVDPVSLCIDPADIERRITPRTRAIVAVHYLGYPADMDPIMAIARRHNLRVLEDASHAHGALYKGKMVGTFGDVSAFSLMSGKSFAIGEGGILLTNDQRVYERAIAFGHYERHGSLTLEDLSANGALPWGGYKYRMHQLSSAVGRIQIKNYPEQMAEIDRAMNYFWDLLEGVPGIRAHRPTKDSGLTKGGWYAPIGFYRTEELGGLSVRRFCEALTAEGIDSHPGVNRPLHLHPLFNSVDVYGEGKPTRNRNAPTDVDLTQPPGSLPVTESVQDRVFSTPWFKKYRPDLIEEYADTVRKVVDHAAELRDGDPGNVPGGGSWSTSRVARPG